MCEIGQVRAEVEFFPIEPDEQSAPARKPTVEPELVDQPAAAPAPVR